MVPIQKNIYRLLLYRKKRKYITKDLFTLKMKQCRGEIYFLQHITKIFIVSYLSYELIYTIRFENKISKTCDNNIFSKVCTQTSMDHFEIMLKM